MRAIGLMSGTSMDGVDVALLETDGETVEEFGPGVFLPYSDEERAVLRQALEEAGSLNDRTSRPGILAQAEAMITDAHAQAVETFLAEHHIPASSVDVIGFHGQTVIHKPAERLTVQIGDGAALADRLGIDVVYDLRAADVAAGGQGAPLVPAYHCALGRMLPERPVVFVNIGGVANVTFVGADDACMAFDTGPGNALIDDWVVRHMGLPRDDDGRLARSGAAPDNGLLDALLSDPYFQLPPAKSLDRNHFSAKALAGLSVADGANLLTHFTACSIAGAVAHLPVRPAKWIVCGGGRHNSYLMETMRSRIEEPVLSAEEAGFNGDLIEAQAFAFLAVRSLRGLPITWPSTTGAPRPMTGGMRVGLRPAA